MPVDKSKAKSNYQRWYWRNIEKNRKYKREQMARLRATKAEHYRAYGRKRNAELRSKLFEIYGSKCESCGYGDKRALTLDHVRNNGSKERKTVGERGVYRRALRTEHRSEYRILCMNCQFIHRVEAGRQNQH